MRRQAGIILQARFGSSRLRGKALAEIAGCTIVERCVRRLARSGVAHVVLATTTAAEDDALAAIAARLGAGVYRGDRDDVLQRFSNAARAFDLDPVVRATGDNPAVDVEAAGRVLAALRDTGADYVREVGLPVGAAVEGIRADALHRAARQATQPYDREHVTTFVLSHPDLFHVRYVDAPVALRRPELRLTVDTAADLARVRELFMRTGSAEPSLASLIAAADGDVLCRAEVA